MKVFTLLWEGTFGNELLRLLVKIVMEVVSQEQVQEDGFGFVLGVKSDCSQTLHVNCSCLLQDFQQLVNSTKELLALEFTKRLVKSRNRFE